MVGSGLVGDIEEQKRVPDEQMLNKKFRKSTGKNVITQEIQIEENSESPDNSLNDTGQFLMGQFGKNNEKGSRNGLGQ